MDQCDLKHRGNKFRSFRIFRVQIIKISVFFRAFRGYYTSTGGEVGGAKKEESSLWELLCKVATKRLNNVGSGSI